MSEKPWKSRVLAAAATLKMTTMIANRTVEPRVSLRVLLLVLIASFAIHAWAQIGYVHALSGSATSQIGSAPPVPTKVGDTFEAGTLFATSGDGRATLKFADGQVLALAPSSRVRIQQYHFDPRNVKASSVAIGLQDGALRFVGGAIATENRDAVRISAGESIVSILRSGGIDLMVVVNTKGQEVGLAAVTLGEISLRTPYGPILRIEANQAVPWRPGTAPPPPVPIAAASAVIQAELAALLAIPIPGLESLIAALPPTAAGPEPAATANPWALPFAPITTLTTPGGRGCVGSPC